jgi:transcriptional regulator with PAS, ATPase and Fis domain
MTQTQTEPSPTGPIPSGGLHRLFVVFSPTPADFGYSRTLGREPLVIGRDPDTRPSLPLRHARVSRRHARIEPTDDPRVFTLQDLESRNGTFVNGKRVERAELRDGDVIRIGASLIVLQYLDAAACMRVLEPEAVNAGKLVGHGHAIASVREAIRSAPANAPTLIQGETGVGKELVAEAIHEFSGRDGPFVPVNCAALPTTLAESELFGAVRGAYTGADARRGLFGRADRGTLFLDEIGEVSPDVQAKLLRALAIGEIRPVGSDQPRYVDVRIVAATNVDLEAAVAGGRFRPDLYARLMAHIITVPALRERREDILELTRHFLKGAGKFEITADAAEALLSYQWPYNVRELEQVLTSMTPAVQKRGVLELADLPMRVRGHLDSARVPPGAAPELPAVSLLDLRRNAAPSADELRAVVEAYSGNIAKVASFFGKDRRQIYRWAQALGVDIRALRENREAHGRTLPPGIADPIPEDDGG